MAIYQIKLKGKEGLLSYHTFLAQNVEDAIKEADDLEEIEGVNLLLCENDIYQAVKELKIKLDGALRDLRVLAEEGCDNYGPDLDFADLDFTMELIREKTSQVYSLMNALYEITTDTPSRFGYKEKDES